MVANNLKSLNKYGTTLKVEAPRAQLEYRKP